MFGRVISSLASGRGSGGGQRGCSDRIVVKDGGAAPGYPLKQAMTITSEQGTFTTTTEVDERHPGGATVRHAARIPIRDMSAMIAGLASDIA
jgi:hypothetical protein